MIMAIFQIGMVFVAGQVLEDATTEFGRLIRTGQAQGGRVDQASFRAAFCDRIAVFMNCDNNNLLIDIQVLPSFGNVSLDWPTDEDGNFDDFRELPARREPADGPHARLLPVSGLASVRRHDHGQSSKRQAPLVGKHGVPQ